MPEEKLLERVRALLAKAEDEGATPAEAEALSAKAAELMAKYGIERAMIGALRPERDKPADRRFVIEEPYATTKLVLLNGLALAMGCQAIKLSGEKRVTLHVFGYESDLDRAELMYTSLLVQMHRATVYAERSIGSYDRKHIRAWRRSFMLGYITAANRRVKEVEDAARGNAMAEETTGKSTELVLVNREVAVKNAYKAAYPRTTSHKLTYSGTGYGQGYREGQRADIGGSKLGGGSGRAISR